MKPLENVWSGLVQRRLLPVAILLLAALAAIPFVLAKDPEPVAAPPAAPVAADEEAAGSVTGTPVVSVVAEGERTQRRRVLGARKNPFEPAWVKPAKADDATSTTTTITNTEDTAASGDKPAGGTTETGGTTPSPGPAPVDIPAPTVPVPEGSDSAPERHELYSLVVRFGNSESETLQRMSLARLKPLPDAEAPSLVYLGVSGDKKSAIFMVDADVKAQGDGTCSPTPDNCETIRLREGETEFFDVLDAEGEPSAQYQLDLVKIRRSTTASASEAAAARAKASKAGRRVLRAHQASSGPLRFRYDTKSGTVRKIGKRAYKVLVAKTARTALATAGGF